MGQYAETETLRQADSRATNSAAKTLYVLEGMLASEGPAQLADIARRCGLPKPTVHRILQTLAATDFVRGTGGGAYTAGPRLLALSGRVLLRRDYQTVVRPWLLKLQQRTGHTVHFAVSAGHEAIYVDKVESAQPYRMASRVGMHIPLHCTAIGKAILAVLPDDALDQYLGVETLSKRTKNTLVTRPALLSELHNTRTRGYAIDDEENEEDVRCVAAAVWDNLGQVIGAVSVSGLTFQLSPEDAHGLGSVVCDTAHEMSHALGYTGNMTRRRGED